MVTSQTCLRLGDDVSFESMGNDQGSVILSLGSGYLYTCNDTTAAFLSELDGRRPIGAVVTALEARFAVERERLESDLLALAEELLAERIVAVVS
mgnify:FL=1